jgi:NTP pyrophosphatase (non-canonical NTP hydrolase)
MDLSEYQRQAQATDQVKGATGDAMLVPLLGLAGEVGSLLVEYKKQLRDGPAHRLYREQVSEELGDLLWYVANIASKHSLDLDTIARDNLRKTSARWTREVSGQRPLLPQFFDEQFSADERFPRAFDVDIRTTSTGKVECLCDGVALGDKLDDNAYEDDGYRFHDVFHLSYVAVLGWSPIIRAHLGKKRRSNKQVDDVEDGGRARVIDEAVSAIAYDYARRHGFFEGVTSVDFGLLKTIKSLVSHLEVGRCTHGDWENAILQGYATWRNIRATGGGTVHLDLHRRTIAARQLG